MKIIKYFFEFLFIIILLIIFKIIGLKLASNFGALIAGLLGPFFRSKKRIVSNIKKALPDIGERNIELIIKNMWKNYGRILSEYVFIKNFRNLEYQKFSHPIYSQHFSNSFIPNLSIIDALANLGPKTMKVLTNQSN